MKSGFSTVSFDPFFAVDSQQRTRGHSWKIIKHRSNLDVRKYFGLWIDETNWIKETSIVDVEVSMVSRKDYKEFGRQGEAFSWTRSAKPHGFIGSRKL